VSRLGVRTRVVGAFALVMAVLLAVAGVAIRQGVEAELTDATDDALEAHAELVVDRLDAGRAPGDPGSEDRFVQVIGPGGELRFASPGVPDALVGLAREEPRTVALPEAEDEAEDGFDEDRARVLARAARDGQVVIVGASVEATEDALGALGGVLLVALPLALVLACAAGWVAVGSALRPVERMRRRAAGISETSLDERLPLPEADDELRRLGETLNAMLGRLETALARERSFVADASHELRTPLAILRTELELATRGDRRPDELRAAIVSALEETGKLTALTDDLLLLARSDHGRLSLHREPVDLRALADATAERFAVRAPIAVTGPEVVVEADRARLEQALGGLVENAVRHGAPPVAIRVEPPGTLVVADRGPGVPEGVDVFERFTRGDAARTTEGTGLGLPIVRAIATAHGGRVELRPRAGGGTEAALIVPSS
jgi:signal transduction histidine kinase